MGLALELAGRGRGAVEPNPMVAAVLVRDGDEIGKGWHRGFGLAHAEIEAIHDTRSKQIDPRGSTMYVTLEPCCHQGKTPPCTDAIIRAGVKRVVVGMEDPDEQVSGRGLDALRDAGIDVTVGVMESQVHKLLQAYIKLRTQHHPWVICKWAQTSDGFLALPPEQGRWVSGEKARAKVHELRRLCDGICVGIETVLTDDPLLTNRGGRGKSPARIVLDTRVRLPIDSNLVRTADQSPVIIATTIEGAAASPQRTKQLRSAGVEILELPADANRVHLPTLLDELGNRQWTYLLVEGGAKVLGSFIFSDLVDELLVFVAPEELGAEGETLPRFDVHHVRKKLSLGAPEQQEFGKDMLLRWVLEDKDP